MKKLLIVGGTSAIASESALAFANQGNMLYLADLNYERLQVVKNHIESLTDSKVHIGQYSLTDINDQQKLFDCAKNEMNGLDSILIAYGTLPEQKTIENDATEVTKQLFINFTSICSLLTIAAEYFEKQEKGTIAVISSVAGDRGRQSNYIYGAAKGGLSIFMQGLRNRFGKKNINVITIKPGFVDTPMTANMPKNPLYSSASKVGKSIISSMQKGRDIAYVPGFWRYIMLIIKLIPEKIFKKLSL